MTEEKKNEIIKIRKKFYELFESIDLDEITLFAKWEIEKDLTSLKNPVRLLMTWKNIVYMNV